MSRARAYSRTVFALPFVGLSLLAQAQDSRGVANAIVPPVANAGPNRTVSLGATVILSGAGSTDANGLPLGYAWSFTWTPPGSAAALAGATMVNPSFTLDRMGDYVVRLVVNNGWLRGAPATVTITTNDVAPVANAGSSQSNVVVGSVVELDGSGSTDVNGHALRYSWTLLSAPEGSAAELPGATLVNPAFTVDRPGAYVARLIVDDGSLGSAPATVAITTQSGPPMANAGPSRRVGEGAVVALDGTGSSDPNGYALTYVWSLTAKPPGSQAVLAGASAAKPVITVDKAGSYVAQLIVSDPLFRSQPSTVAIGTDNIPPVANPGAAQNAFVGDTVALHGENSSGTSGYSLTYSWSLTSRPAGSAASLAGATTANPTLVADRPGMYVAQLIVNDIVQNSQPKTVTIAAANAVTLESPAPRQNRTSAATLYPAIRPLPRLPSTPRRTGACILTNNPGSACSTKTCALSAIAADSSHANWTGDGCRRIGYVPANGDTAVVPDGFHLTVDRNWTIGASGANNTTPAINTNGTGLVEVSSGATLRARGDVLSNSNNSDFSGFLVLDAGSSFIFDSSRSASPPTTRYRIGGQNTDGNYRSFASNGTSGSHVTVTSDLTNGALPGQFRIGPVGVASTYTGGESFSSSYTDFSYIGDGTVYGEGFLWGGYSCSPNCNSSPYLASAYIYKLQRNTFDHCGPNVVSGSNGIPGYLRMLLDSNSYTNGQGATNFILYAESPATGVTRTVTNNVFDKPWGGGGANLQPGLVFTGNYFGDGWFVNSGSTGQTTADNIFHISEGGGSSGVTEYFMSSVTGSYFFWDFYTSDNPHVLGARGANSTNSGNIFEQVNDIVADSGEVFNGNGSCSPACTAVFENSIVLPTKTGSSPAELSSGTASGPDATSTISYLHNTVSSNGHGMLQTNEGGANAGPFLAVESNLAWSNGGGYSKTFTVQNTNLLQNAITTADYNGADLNLVLTDPACTLCTNQGKGYIGKWTATPGVHDVQAAPYFADQYRNIPLWDTKYLGRTAAQGAWTASHGYSVGDVASVSAAGVYGGNTVNYRATVAHTANAQNEPNVGLYKIGDGTLTSITTDAGKVLTIHFASNPQLYVGAPLVVEGSATSLLNNTLVTVPTYFVASVAGNSVTLTPTGNAGLTASHTYNDSGITVDVWRSFWEFASNYDLRTAIPAGTTYTDAAIGCVGCTAIQALVKWVQRGYVPQNPAFWCAGHDGETIGAVPFCAAGKALTGTMAGR